MTKCIVIGAGILGATTAYKLAKQGAEVTIIDEPSQGQASAAAAGIICPWLSQRRNKAWFHLATNGARYYPTLVDELKNDGQSHTGYARVGALSIQTTRERLEKTYERGIKQQANLPEMGSLSIVEAEEVKKLFPLATADYEAIHIGGAARVDGHALREALLHAAQTYGATLHEGHATLKEEQNAACVYLDGKRIDADKIVCTTGAWMKETLAPLGVHFNAFPQRGQLLHFQHPDGDMTHWPVFMPANSLSVVPFEDRLVIGSTKENEAGFDLSLTAGGVHDILTKALDVFPSLADWRLIESRVGFRPYTPGSLPVLGALPEFPNVYAANGLGASGLTTGPFVGNQLAKLVVEKELDIDLMDYNIENALETK